MPTQDVAKRDGVENPKNYNLINFKYGKFDALKTARVNRSRPLNNFHTEFALLEKQTCCCCSRPKNTSFAGQISLFPRNYFSTGTIHEKYNKGPNGRFLVKIARVTLTHSRKSIVIIPSFTGFQP